MAHDAEAMLTGPQGTKACGRCGQRKPLTAFNTNKNSPDGREWCCKACKPAYRNDYTGRRENPKATEKRRRKAALFFDNPTWTLDECAALLDCKPDSIRRAVAVEDPDGTRRLRRREQAAEIRAEQEYQERLRNASPCLVCGEYVLRGPTFKTCSHECAELWRTGRVRLSEEEHEKHRRHVAKSILKNPEKRKDVEIRWAKRMLSDDPPPPTRRYSIQGSEAEQAEDEGRKKLRETMRHRSPKREPLPADDGPFIDWTEVAS